MGPTEVPLSLQFFLYFFIRYLAYLFKSFITFLKFLFYFFATPHSITDLSSPTRDQTHALFSKNRILTTGPTGNSHSNFKNNTFSPFVPSSPLGVGQWGKAAALRLPQTLKRPHLSRKGQSNWALTSGATSLGERELPFLTFCTQSTKLFFMIAFPS